MMREVSLPAVLGGKPIFEVNIPITKPTVPSGGELTEGIQGILNTGMITNGHCVGRFEKAVAGYLGVKDVVAVSSCTSGLLLVLKALALKGGVILPSFTFAATGHVVLWNGLRPRFVDISGSTFNVDTQQVERALIEQRSAILGVHIFGNPCDVEGLEKLAEKHRVKLVFDAAHALGSIYDGRTIGTCGDVEVFSLSPTKLVVGGEGGLVATNDATLARLVRIGRDYGNPGNYNCEFPGLNARMPEFNALLAMWSLERLEAHLEKRSLLANTYRSLLAGLPGVSFQDVWPNCRTTYKDFSVVIDPVRFGLTRDQLALALEHENITTRRYFDPPLHRQQAYCQYRAGSEGQLPVTEKIAGCILCLPIFSHIERSVVEKICEAIHRIHRHSADVVAGLSQGGTR